MTHVFISYSHKDAVFAQEIKRQIENAGFENWIDGDQLKAGQNWAEEIRSAIDAAYAVIVIKSPSSYRSQYVTSEWSYARGAGVPIIPILYKRQRTKNALLDDIQHLDFTNPMESVWNDLFHILKEQRNTHGIKVRVPKDAPPNIQAGLKKLNSHFPEEVMDGVRLLGNLENPIAVPGLITTLGHTNNEVMNAALQALIKIGDLAVPQMLKTFLEFKDENLCLTIGIGLAQIKSDAALYGLLNILNDQRNRVRYITAYSLGEMKRVEAVPELIKLLHDEDNIVRHGVIVALIEIGNKVALPALVEALQDIDKDNRSVAAGGLGVLGDAIAVPALVDALHDSEFYVRIAAANALGRIRDPRGVDELFKLSVDPIPGVRQAALDALNRIGTQEAMAAIYKWPNN